MIEELEDPFANYPELIKEREKARKLKEKEEKLGRPPSKRGGLRIGAGAKKKDYKVFRVSFVINKQNEPELIEKINELKGIYESKLG
tara:strand:- start:481 stop:741 length:261 start_codon:yes stop_codon:yes gene_type:complete